MDIYTKPKNFADAQKLTDSGELREKLYYQLILLAFGENSTVALKSCELLLSMPEAPRKNWLDQLTTEQLQLVESHLSQYEKELHDVIRSH